jgi:ATP-dependent DNA helicase PIF1
MATMNMAMVRNQFPIKPAFSMTINKSQGQTIPIIGLHLEDQVFSHGQLYVGLSRASRISDVYIYCPSGKATNIVYKEVFSIA